jgi:hypothetical protein
MVLYAPVALIFNVDTEGHHTPQTVSKLGLHVLAELLVVQDDESYLFVFGDALWAWQLIAILDGIEHSGCRCLYTVRWSFRTLNATL